MVAMISATALGYLSGVLGIIIVIALVSSLILVNSILEKVGGGPRSALASVVDSLGAVAANTDPVPPTLTAINDGLAALAKEMRAIEGHLATGKAVFDGYASGTMG
ncbi:MAG: hypothetical protein JO287_02255 [Pseudonocardiales bacterium]|nr:hypothetical protein [Pseudonocardiales bacterium]